MIMANHVFISHSSQDKPTADAVCATLESAGISCWIAPRDIPAGRPFPEAIVSALSDSPVMILIFSGAANHSRHVSKEIALAVSTDKSIIPLRIDNASPQGIIKYYLADAEWLDGTGLDAGEQAAILVQAVKPLMEAKREEKLASVGFHGKIEKDKANRAERKRQPGTLKRILRPLAFSTIGLAALLTLLFYRGFFTAPEQPDETLQAVLAGGEVHSLVLLDNNNLFVFGCNSLGQLGLGDTVKQLLPIRLEQFKGVKAVAAGDAHSLVLLENGELYSFGDNSYGQLGHGDRTNRHAPTLIAALNGVKTIAAGSYHSLAVLESGEFYTFGAGWSGMLGHGNSENKLFPTQVTNLADVTAVAAGNRHSLALLENGEVYSFGNGQYGQLGHGDRTNRLVPTKIEFLDEVKTIAAGSYHSLALLDNGEVLSFGPGWNGMLGHGDTETRFTPTRIAGLEGAVKIAGGARHSLVLLENGTVFSFGAGEGGLLGHGDENDRHVPTMIEGLPEIKALAAGSKHSLLQAPDNTVYSFGQGKDGQLGQGEIDHLLKPALLAAIPMIAPGGKEETNWHSTEEKVPGSDNNTLEPGAGFPVQLVSGESRQAAVKNLLFANHNELGFSGVPYDPDGNPVTFSPERQNYRNRFSKSSADVIFWVLFLEHPSWPDDATFATNVIYHNPDGSKLHEQSAVHIIEKGMTDTIVWGSFGFTGSFAAFHSDAGEWLPGNYRVEVVGNEGIIAEDTFEIY